MTDQNQESRQVNISDNNASELNIGPIVTGRVGGDVVGGDKITVGDIAGNTVAIGRGATAIGKVINYFTGSDQQRDLRNRQAMLTLVHNTWVKGVLENSLHNEVLIELDLEERQDAIDHPWEMELRRAGQVNRSIRAEVKMATVFDEVGQNLLILGDPGSGKTTMLLELARETIARARADNSQPIPVVFNLSSWADSRQSIADWLVAELNTKYNIPKKIAQDWVETDALLLLLDGLDEVAERRQEACVTAINEFHQAHLMPLVVCSRSADYERLPTRLRLESAVFIKPLTPEKIDRYLSNDRLELGAVKATLQHDKPLQELAQTPLMLSIMTLAYQGLLAEDLRQLDTVETRRKHLFDTYIKRMFKRRGNDKRYAPEQTGFYLTSLAQTMWQYAQTIFLIEQLQPHWLTSEAWRWMYLLGSRLISGAVLGLLFTVVFQTHWFLGLIAGLGVGLLDGLRLNTNYRGSKIINVPARWQPVWQVSKVTVMVGLVASLSSWLLNSVYFVDMFWGIFTYGIIEEMPAQSQWLFEDLIQRLRFWIQDGVILGVIFGLLFGLRACWQTITDDIHLPETFVWSWQQALRGGLVGIIIWPVVQIVYDFLNWLFDDISFALLPLITGQSIEDIQYSLFGGIVEGWSVAIGGPTLWLIYGLRGFIIVGLFFGFTVKIAEKSARVNYRITILVSLIFAAAGAFLSWLGYEQVLYFVGGQDYNWKMSLNGAALAGMFAFVWYGGLDMIQHFSLRFILWITSQLPFRLVPFLNRATDLIFLHKVGGGYIFIHRLLMEHFASLTEEDIERLAGDIT